MTLRHGLSLILLILSCQFAFAEEEIETISLLNRTAEDVIPALQPFVRSGGSLTGTGYKLIIRSTPENIEEIKRMLAAIDSELKQVLITVATMGQIDQLQDASRAQVVIESGDVSASVGSAGTPGAPGAGVSVGTGNVQADVSVMQTQRQQTVPGMQQMRVVEGTWGSIQMGQQIPIMSRTRNPDGTVTATMTYKNVTSGFHVLPRLSNDTVTLTIRPHKANVSAQGGGAIDVASMDTTVTGKLGQWISLGGATSSQSSQSSGIATSTRTRSSQADELWVKVEVLSR